MHYHGKLCKKCSSTLRYTNGKRCVICKRKRERNNREQRTPEQKEIIRAKRKEKYWRNPSKARAYSRQWRADNREQAAIADREWANRNPEKSRAVKRKWEKSNPEKKKAVQRINSATRRGDIPKANTIPCNRCNKQAQNYHHWSYKEEHWLDVEALCLRCHNLADKERRELESLSPDKAKEKQCIIPQYA